MNADDIAAAIAAASWPTPSARRTGRHARWPYVPVLVSPTGTVMQIRARAFATRAEAIADAAAHIERQQASTASQLAEPRHRALREQFGLPREMFGKVLTCVTE